MKLKRSQTNFYSSLIKENKYNNNLDLEKRFESRENVIKDTNSAITKQAIVYDISKKKTNLKYRLCNLQLNKSIRYNENNDKLKLKHNKSVNSNNKSNYNKVRFDFNNLSNFKDESIFASNSNSIKNTDNLGELKQGFNEENSMIDHLRKINHNDHEKLTFSNSISNINNEIRRMNNNNHGNHNNSNNKGDHTSQNNINKLFQLQLNKNSKLKRISEEHTQSNLTNDINSHKLRNLKASSVNSNEADYITNNISKNINGLNVNTNRTNMTYKPYFQLDKNMNLKNFDRHCKSNNSNSTNINDKSELIKKHLPSISKMSIIKTTTKKSNNNFSITSKMSNSLSVKSLKEKISNINCNFNDAAFENSRNLSTNNYLLHDTKSSVSILEYNNANSANYANNDIIHITHDSYDKERDASSSINKSSESKIKFSSIPEYNNDYNTDINNENIIKSRIFNFNSDDKARKMKHKRKKIYTNSYKKYLNELIDKKVLGYSSFMKSIKNKKLNNGEDKEESNSHEEKSNDISFNIDSVGKNDNFNAYGTYISNLNSSGVNNNNLKKLNIKKIEIKHSGIYNTTKINNINSINNLINNTSDLLDYTNTKTNTNTNTNNIVLDKNNSTDNKGTYLLSKNNYNDKSNTKSVKSLFITKSDVVQNNDKDNLRKNTNKINNTSLEALSPSSIKLKKLTFSKSRNQIFSDSNNRNTGNNVNTDNINLNDNANTLTNSNIEALNLTNTNSNTIVNIKNQLSNDISIKQQNHKPSTFSNKKSLNKMKQNFLLKSTPMKVTNMDSNTQINTQANKPSSNKNINDKENCRKNTIRTTDSKSKYTPLIQYINGEVADYIYTSSNICNINNLYSHSNYNDTNNKINGTGTGNLSLSIKKSSAKINMNLNSDKALSNKNNINTSNSDILPSLYLNTSEQIQSLNKDYSDLQKNILKYNKDIDNIPSKKNLLLILESSVHNQKFNHKHKDEVLYQIKLVGDKLKMNTLSSKAVHFYNLNDNEQTHFLSKKDISSVPNEADKIIKTAGEVIVKYKSLFENKYGKFNEDSDSNNDDKKSKNKRKSNDNGEDDINHIKLDSEEMMSNIKRYLNIRKSIESFGKKRNIAFKNNHDKILKILENDYVISNSIGKK